MDNARQQIVDSIRNHNNILVTVSDSPSVDELSAALGLTILLNNMDKRATAVVSGDIPPAINFLEPNKTFENTTDSLRDFIIALDKEKADHLRYKVDGDLVKIFITPYRTTLSQADLEFSQGDYNVELIVAIGVKDQDHLDKSLAAHGKILHDATVVTVTSGESGSTLGSTDWHDAAASSLSEMMVGLVDGLKEDKPLLDEQISSAFLTGIVSATDRFSNDKTTSRVMTMAAQLMAAGANQQLIAAKLEEAHDIGPASMKVSQSNNTAPVTKDDQSNELTIDRSDRQKDEPIETKTDSIPEQEPQQASQEAQDQIELEKELAGITVPPTNTMADIEKELKEATGVSDAPEPKTDQAIEPLTAASDDTMPGFETTGALVAPEEHATEVSQPEVPSLSPVPPIPIINEHGTFSNEPPQTSPLNSIQTESSDESTVDPLYSPVDESVMETSQPSFEPELQSVESEQPVSNANESLEPPVAAFGTPEGAAFLSGEPSSPAPDAPLAPPSIPPLPPLPPLPTDGSLPPLPPPPPPINFGQPSAPLPPGAVPADQLGDIFGDAAASQTQNAPAQPAPEPGQYRIPGQ